MLLRTLLTLVNIGALAALIAGLHYFPQAAGAALYLVIGWMFGSLVLIYGPWANRQIGGGSPTAPATPPATGAPLASAGPGEVPFCIYCAAPITRGAAVCASCGHRSPQL